MEDDHVAVAPRKRAATPVLWPSLKVGAFTGFTGAVVGATAGVIRTSTPGLFAAASGIQCFALGSVFWATRTAVLDAWDIGNLGASNRRNASAIAGGMAGGAVAAATRGPRNIIPGIIVMSGLGFFSQSAYNILDRRNTAQVTGETPKDGILMRFMKSKWSPMSVLTDDEYEKLLREKMLRLDAEIALIDERIDKVKQDASPLDPNSDRK